MNHSDRPSAIGRSHPDGAPRPLISIVTPAFDEQESLLELYSQIRESLGDIEWEWLVIDDHSGDMTFDIVSDLAAHDPRVRGIRLSRNSGTHIASRCGMDLAHGDAVVIMASDLQDPPEVIPKLVEKWQQGSHVVWAVRASRPGESAATRGSSRLYHWMMRRLVGVEQTPSGGADFFLIDRSVVDALGEFRERHVSILTLVAWLGFKQSEMPYEKKARSVGRSKWTMKKKLKLVVDSVLSFTYGPIRVISYLGIVIALLGLIYASIVFFNAVTGNPPEGWSSLMVVVLVLGGIQMVMIGVLGEYTWRAFDESRGRPVYTIEAVTNEAAANIKEKDVQRRLGRI